LSNSRKTPVLVIDSNQLDFVHNSQDLDWIENRVRQVLQMAPFQPELPIDARSPVHAD